MKAIEKTSRKSMFFIGLLAAGLASPALAQTSSSGAEGLLNDKWVVSLGAFAFGTDIRARLNGEAAKKPEVDFDQTFGKANDSTRVRADALWRIAPAHHLRFMYFNNSNTRTKTLGEELQWGDYTFQKDSSASFKNELQIVALAYEYAFFRRPNYELSASLGLHYMDLKMQLSGTAIATGPACGSTTCAATLTSKVSSLPAPLPVLGLRGGWMIAPDWYMDAQVQALGVEIDGYKGTWYDMRVGATWMFHRNFGLSLGYNRFNTTVDIDRKNFDGKLKVGYSGPQVYLTGSF